MALSSVHHPQTDGQTEVLNASIEKMLHAYVASNCALWLEWLSIMSHMHNSAVHLSTLYSPNFLLMGYKPQILAGLLVPASDLVDHPFLSSQKGEEFVELLESHRQFAQDALALAQEWQAKAYNKGCQLVVEFKEGDYTLVNPHSLQLVNVQGTRKKCIQRMIGPFKVIEKINPIVYGLLPPDNYPMHPVFNLEHLKKYTISDPKFGERSVLPSTQDFMASKEYDVKAILGHWLTTQKTGSRHIYLVQWKGYNPTNNSWVSEYDLWHPP
jgi:hypothetical protein